MRGFVTSSFVLLLLSSENLLLSQVPCPPIQAGKPEAVRPEIPDEPKTVDPATLVPEMLAKKVTVEFENASLREVVTWIAEKQNIQILIDPMVSELIAPLLDAKSIREKLEDAPLYLLLDRLKPLELDWYVEDEILFVTTRDEIEILMTYTSYNLSDLLDAGYSRAGITKTIELMLPMTNWSYGLALTDWEVGSLEWIDDVLFIRQTSDLQRQIAGIIEALRQPSRMRFTYDPPVHEALRNMLETKVSVDLNNTPLAESIASLARQTKTDIRIDREEVEYYRDGKRESVTFKMTDRKLSTVLNLMLAPLSLTWVLKDGAILITSIGEAEKEYKAAVYLIGDLCQNEDETKALFKVIMQQTVGNRRSGVSAYWNEESALNDPEGGTMLSPCPGVMIVRQTEPILLEIKRILDNYRFERQKSDNRKRKGPADEILTRYYRMHSELANDLEHGLPLIVAPGSWVTESNPDGPGQVLLKISSPVEVQNSDQPNTENDAGNPKTEEVSSYSVLVIKHQRKVHEQIEKIFDRIKNGDLGLRDERLKTIAPARFGSGVK